MENSYYTILRLYKTRKTGEYGVYWPRLDRHRSMEQNGELAIDPHKYSPLIFKVAKGSSMKEGWSFQQMMWNNWTSIYQERMKWKN